MKAWVTKRFGWVVLGCLLQIGCGAAIPLPNSVEPSNNTVNAEPTGEFQILRRSDGYSRSVLAGVYPGDTVALEIHGAPAGGAVTWSTNDPTLGSITAGGTLHLHHAGTLEVVAEQAGQVATLQVRVGVAPNATPEPETPAPTTTPAPVTTPVPATPTPTPTPAPGPSDPYMDEVVSFSPGPNAGFGSDQFPEIVLGAPQGSGASIGGFHVLSLGKGGEIILRSDRPILDGSGEDLIVFENPFYVGGNPENIFAEPGEVAASQDGVTFLTFPCAAEDAAGHYPGCAGVHPVLANPLVNAIDPTDPETAGGDAYDLGAIGLSWARYIRVRDVSESGGGNSAGFDLDAISIIHQ